MHQTLVTEGTEGWRASGRPRIVKTGWKKQPKPCAASASLTRLTLEAIRRARSLLPQIAQTLTRGRKEDVPRFPKTIRQCREFSEGGADTSGPQRRLVDYVTMHVCVCVCVTVVTPFSILPSDPLCITGTRHGLHNASPPQRSCGAKQRRPASSNTATEADGGGPAACL